MSSEITIEEAKEIQDSEIALLKKEIEDKNLLISHLKDKVETRNIKIVELKTRINSNKKQLMGVIRDMDLGKTKDVSELTDIMENVCAYFNINLKDLIGTRREKRFIKARHIAMYLCREQGFSFPDIGQALNKDHTTAMNGVKKIEKQLKVDTELERIIEEIK